MLEKTDINTFSVKRKFDFTTSILAARCQNVQKLELMKYSSLHLEKILRAFALQSKDLWTGVRVWPAKVHGLSRLILGMSENAKLGFRNYWIVW